MLPFKVEKYEAENSRNVPKIKAFVSLENNDSVLESRKISLKDGLEVKSFFGSSLKWKFEDRPSELKISQKLVKNTARLMTKIEKKYI